MHFNQGATASDTHRHVVHHVSSIVPVVVVLRSPIHANEPSEYNDMLYRTSNRVLNNGIKVIILICMDGTSQYHHHHCSSVGIPRLNIFRTQLGVIMVPSNQQNQTPNQNKIKMIPQSQGVDLLLFRPFKIRIFAWFRVKKVGENHRMYHSHYGSGGIEKSHSCKWAKWIQWHALPHIQQSTQQRNKGYYPNLHGWDFSIPPLPTLPTIAMKFSVLCEFSVLTQHRYC